MWLLAVLSFVFFPLLISMVDFIPALRAGRARAVQPTEESPTEHNFAVLVPIFGNIEYLENVEFLRAYGDRVVLCTTDQESEEFYRDIELLTQDYGFRVVRAQLQTGEVASGKRSTTSPIRDVIVREAVRTVTQEYVVCLDADSFPDLGFEYLVGAMKSNGFEVVSTRLVPSNQDRFLGKLQVIEYFLAMNLRRILPWLVSGGCHAATTVAYRQVMESHSMFFQGNDVEVGLLGERFGFTVGHVEFQVGTAVPDRLRPWFRQRWAWNGGEWRLAIANIKFAPSHPFFYFYATVIMILLFPIRWYSLVQNPWVLVLVYVIYFVLISVLLRRRWTWMCLVYPLYSCWNSLVMIALGGISYVRMSTQHHNWGQITRARSRQPLHPSQGSRAVEGERRALGNEPDLP